MGRAVLVAVLLMRIHDNTIYRVALLSMAVYSNHGDMLAGIIHSTPFYQRADYDVRHIRYIFVHLSLCLHIHSNTLTVEKTKILELNARQQTIIDKHKIWENAYQSPSGMLTIFGLKQYV